MENNMNRQQNSPSEILYEIFGERVGVLPISGGWGHTRELAIIINKNDSNINYKKPFNGFEIENTFIRYRTYIEFIRNEPLKEKNYQELNL